MNSKNTIVGVVVILVLAAAGYYIYQRQLKTYQVEPAGTKNSEAGQTAGVTHSVSMNAQGFSPETLTVKAGGTVVFKNDDSRNRWPASDVHPTHKVCLGLDAFGPVQTARSYAYTFSEAKECPIHDHLIPSLKGKITVTP